ncbi:XRE family transcriptional regulator [Pseudonocardiaceae bacterium YIM PH 21723]|nr:XRE family transcriptional regulator [Pseudonocardiaceae bacterium YIM PH 21723]
MAEKVSGLIRGMQGATGRPGVHVIARQITDSTGVPISGAYLNQLATGKRDNPSLRQMEALAAYFGVDISFFAGRNPVEPAPVSSDNGLESALNDPGIQMIALRTEGLSDQSKQAILSMIEQARKIEQLDGDDHDEPAS